MSLIITFNKVCWILLTLICTAILSCETAREPVVFVPEPVHVSKSFMSEEPPLAFVYSSEMALEKDISDNIYFFSLAAPMGSRLEFEIRPLSQPIDIEALGPALVSVDQQHMTEHRDAEDFSQYIITDLAGKKGLSYDFIEKNHKGTRILQPADQKLYITTVRINEEQDRPLIEEVLQNVQFQYDPGILAEAAVRVQPASDLTLESMPELLWSFCPHNLNQAAQAISVRLSQNPSDAVWLSLDSELKALKAIALKQQNRQIPEFDSRALLEQARNSARVLENSAQAQRALGLTLLLNQNMTQSRQAISRALSISEQQPYSMLAMALWHGPVASEVEPILNQVESSSSDIPAIWLLRAWLAEARNNTSQAQDAYRRTLALNPRNTAALTGLGRIEMQEQRTALLAAERFNQVLAVNPADDVALFNLSLISLREAEHDKALTMIRQFLNYHSHDAPGWNLQGQIFRAKGQFQDAADSFRTAVDIDSEYAGAYFNLGVLCAENLADTECAREAFTSFLRLEPEGQRASQVRNWIDRN